jgi:hypothetical protein
LSALALAKATKHGRRAFGGRRKDERIGQLVEVAFSDIDIAHGAQSIERASGRWRRENRHSTPAVRHLDRFPLLDAAQEFAGSLSEFTNTN